MNGFKLIAITPLKNCNTNFCKNLIPGTPYQFYKNYQIKFDNQTGRIIEVTKTESKVPDDLYCLPNGIKLNITAVVGKNGTGKSSLFELLAYAVYLIATIKEINGNTIINRRSEELIEKQIQLAEDFKRLQDWNNIIKDQISGDQNKKLPRSLSAELIKIIEKYDLKIDFSKPQSGFDTLLKIYSEVGFQEGLHQKLIREEREKEQKIESQLNMSLIYEVGEDVFELEFFHGKFRQSRFSPTKTLLCDSLEKLDLSTFFYSIIVNYSHHSYNSKSIGDWVSQLFHKNDGYVTPIVINPMRSKGNFDINHELSLSKERLFSNVIFNLVNNRNYKLLNKYQVTKFIFKPKSYRRYVSNPGIKFPENSTFLKLIQVKTGINSFNEKLFYWEIAFGYLDHKIGRISNNYASLIFKNSENANELFDFLMEDKSHITKKVRQTLNFLWSTKQKENFNLWEHPEGNVTVTLTPTKMLKWLGTFNLPINQLTPTQLIEYALPGFFSIDFELTDNSNTIVKFENLSSGEQQMILNENSILYHLYNLQSVHSPEVNETTLPERIEYENINIVFDEIEMYYHPDMQRQLVKSVIDSLINVKKKGDKGIAAINICFLTHSPFILSDIPKENVLRLSENPNEINEPIIETFGSNIYDLLGDSFFMKDGFIGSYAMSIIQEILNYIENKKYNEIDQQKYLKWARIISDEIISDKLLEMLLEKEIEIKD